MKHLRASTTDQAMELSLGIGVLRGKPEASYLPELIANVPRLEKTAAFQAIRSGQVIEHGGTRFYFSRFSGPVGYNQGMLTNWIRVEITVSGDPIIHSFPADIASVRKYIPGAQ